MRHKECIGGLLGSEWIHLRDLQEGSNFQQLSGKTAVLHSHQTLLIQLLTINTETCVLTLL